MTGSPWTQATEEAKEAFEQEAVQHMDALYRTALRMTRHPEDAEDLVQETFLRAIRFFDKFKPGTNLKAWLFKILTNIFINQYRKAAREPDIDDLDDTEEFYLYRNVREVGSPPLSKSAEAAALDQIGQESIIEAIEGLPEPYRLAVLLVDVEGFSYKEIAEMTASKLGTVMSRIARGRKMLQRILWDEVRPARHEGNESSSQIEGSA